jgi:hypothetical protein
MGRRFFCVDGLLEKPVSFVADTALPSARRKIARTIVAA